VQSLDILSNLQTLDIVLHGILNTQALQIPARIYIPSLRRLVVKSFSDHDPHIFLQALHVPNIESLLIANATMLQVSVRPLLRFLTKNNTMSLLTRLSLYGFTEANEDPPWLTQFPKLQGLGFHYCSVDAGTIASLTHGQSTPPELWLCPLLSNVIFERSEIPWTKAIKFVESRTLNGNIMMPRLLRRVTFDSCEDLADEHRSQLLQLRDGSSGTLYIAIKDKDPNDRHYRPFLGRFHPGEF